MFLNYYEKNSFSISHIGVLLILFMRTKCSSYNGIFYQVLPNQQDVAVITAQNDSITYSGKISIPATITVDEHQYKVTHIGASAFAGSDITSISLPEGLLEIGYEAFRQCYSLTTIVIPASVLHIAGKAFLFCFNLSSLSFKAQTKPIIGSYAFGKTKVEVKGVSTGIPSNMPVPTQDGERYKVDSRAGVVVY